ncbi:MAG: hypothetical protein Q8P32_02890 [Candidatus Komeilibacteria bacterium]|nr:hypothetical protein [Candidatus Komeilibacteria bacterium]
MLLKQKILHALLIVSIAGMLISFTWFIGMLMFHLDFNLWPIILAVGSFGLSHWLRYHSPIKDSEAVQKASQILEGK